ncbi:MAG: DUF423 domain-containing protein [archaeon]|nr:DUF423 domain-containing protein [archaeon]
MDYHRAGGVLGALAIILGAFGAHGLNGKVSDTQMDAWKTASTYHLIHSVAMLALSGPQHRPAAVCFLTGTTLFSGSLYAYAVTGEKGFGKVAPIGGLTLIAGWVLLALKRR